MTHHVIITTNNGQDCLLSTKVEDPDHGTVLDILLANLRYGNTGTNRAQTATIHTRSIAFNNQDAWIFVRKDAK